MRKSGGPPRGEAQFESVRSQLLVMKDYRCLRNVLEIPAARAQRNGQVNAFTKAGRVVVHGAIAPPTAAP
jgi:hypothetical protein